jgi:hypothetical protein
MSLSRVNYESGDSESETEESQFSRISRRGSLRSKGSGHNIFKDLLNAGKNRKHTKSGGALNHSDDGGGHSASGAGRSSLTNAFSSRYSDSGSDSESGRNSVASTNGDHHERNNLFKNIMTSRNKKSNQNLAGAAAAAIASSGSSSNLAAQSQLSSSNSSLNSSPQSTPKQSTTTQPQPAATISGGTAIPVVESPSSVAVTPNSPGSAHLAPPLSTGNETLHRSQSETSLSDKYGKKEEVLGKGANAVVRLCCPVNSDKKFAIKEFRPRRKGETQVCYVFVGLSLPDCSRMET